MPQPRPEQPPLAVPRARYGIYAAVLVIAAAIGSAGYVAFARYQRAQNPPLAMWRDGVIMAVRNCDLPHGEAAFLTCAGMHCLQRVTQQLAYPMESEVALIETVRLDDGRFRVSGRIAPFPRLPDKPNAFHCVMRDHLNAAPDYTIEPAAANPPHRR